MSRDRDMTFHQRLRVLKSTIEEPPFDEGGEGGIIQRSEVVPTRRADVVSDQVRVELHGEVIAALGPRLNRSRRNGGSDQDANVQVMIESAVTDQIAKLDRPLSEAERNSLFTDVMADVQGYGPIDRYIRDDNVSEIMVNGPGQVYIERDGRIIETETRFVDDAHVERIIDRIVSEIGRRVDESSPMVDARLPDGSRVNAIIAPLSLVGPILTIRKFRAEPLKTEDLVRFGTLTLQAARFLEACVEGKANVLISGGTGTGKTTTLNVLSAAVPESERIVTIEDAAELQLSQKHLLRLESRPANIEGNGEVSIRELLRNTLRMRPDRIIIGECRGPEAIDMLQAMNTGHDGSMTTIHANSPRDALARVETMVLTSGVDLPMKAIREQVASALHLVVQLNRLVDGTRRVTRITEVGRMEGDVIVMQDLFRADPLEGADGERGLLGPLKATGVRPLFLNHLKQAGVSIPEHLYQDSVDIPDTTPQRRVNKSVARPAATEALT